MWKNTYKDYRGDERWVKEQVEPGSGIIGCEMHEVHGWGEKQHELKPRKKGFIRTFFALIFRKEAE